MPQMNCENPRPDDAYLVGSVVSAHGGVDSGFLEKVRGKICQSSPPADPPDPASDPHCIEVDADMTGTFWQIDALTNLQLGANQLGLWGFFSSSGWNRANPVPITGFDNPSGGPPWSPPPGGGPVPPPAGPPQGVPPVPHPGAHPPGGQGPQMRAAVMGGLPPAPPVPPPGAVIPTLAAQFKLRVNRWRLARLSDARQLLNAGLLQAAPVTLNYDFGLSDLTRMVWSASATTLAGEDPATASKWILELPLPAAAAPGEMFALVYLQQISGGSINIDYWASFIFDPTTETRFLPHSGQHDVLIVLP